MKKQTIEYFFIGLLIAFTISVIVLSVIMALVFEGAVLPVTLVWQSLILSALCSLVNLVYRSEKLKFIWQSIIGYILTTATIITCGLVFGWYGYGGNSFDRVSLVVLSFLVYSVFYLITWIIIWRITIAKKNELNDKLMEYKQRH
ncbi:MAG: hypothetical protein APF77_20640 [Clostridia bacterium BRH_c25]|nr:MAG: hypothetical protein APF77_20640 [Clostridia bacterium BRH_c25]